MDKTQLNILVASYQGGDELALTGIFNSINPIIERTSRELERFVEDSTKFDCRMALKVKKLIETFDKEKHDFYSAVKAIASKEKADFLRRRSRKGQHVSMDKLESPEGADVGGYQFRDTRTNTEEEVLLKEKIALLTQGDSRKEIIVSEWSKGVQDDKSIALLLTQQFGGSIHTQRSFLQRFRLKCRSLLTEEATA